MKMENGEWKMNDTVYGVSPGLVYISYGDIAMRRRLNHSVHSPSSIIPKKEQRPALSKRNAVISLHFYQICEVNTL